MLFRSKTAIQIIFPEQCIENQSFQKHKNREDRVNFSAKTQTISAMITLNATLTNAEQLIRTQ